MPGDSVMRFPVNRLYKACIRQIAEQRRQHELAQSLLTQHSFRQAFTPAATPRRVEWSEL